MAGQTEPAHFAVTIPGVAGSADELGLWQSPHGRSSAEAFGPGRQQPSQIQASLWQVNLPSDPLLAHLAFEVQIARLESAEQALPDASRRLQDFVRESLAQGAESFSARLGQRQDKPEQELAMWVSAASAEVSFGLFDNLPADWKAIAQRSSAFFDRVRHLLLHFAWVESSSDGRRLGLTTVSWTGHFQTAWGDNLGTTEVEQHIGSLNLALRTRAAWLQMALLIARGSVQLGVLFPTNPFLAIPAAWQFVKQVLELSQELNQPISS